jgi:hypothetical protein
MKLFRKIKVLVLVFALAVVIWGSLYVSASAKHCLLLCKFDPVYECQIVCYK